MTENASQLKTHGYSTQEVDAKPWLRDPEVDLSTAVTQPHTNFTMFTESRSKHT